MHLLCGGSILAPDFGAHFHLVYPLFRCVFSPLFVQVLRFEDLGDTVGGSTVSLRGGRPLRRGWQEGEEVGREGGVGEAQR